MNSDPLFSDDVQILRQEIVRLRSLLDSDYRVQEVYRVQCEHLKSLVESFITHGYNK